MRTIMRNTERTNMRINIAYLLECLCTHIRPHSNLQIILLSINDINNCKNDEDNYDTIILMMIMII